MMEITFMGSPDSAVATTRIQRSVPGWHKEVITFLFITCYIHSKGALCFGHHNSIDVNFCFCSDVNGIRVSRKANPTFGKKRHQKEEDKNSSTKPTSHNVKTGVTIRGRLPRKERKRGRNPSSLVRSSKPSNRFRPITNTNNHQKPEKFRQLDRTPRQQLESPTEPAKPLKITLANQVVEVSQEKDRKYHFE